MRRTILSAALVVLVSAALVVLVAGGAGAQPTAPAGGGAAPRSDLQTVAPPRGLPVEQERDPGRGPTSHEPVLLEPAATTTEHLRFGLSAWIAPGTPFDNRENPGGPAVGLTIMWPAPTPNEPSGPSPWRRSAAR